MNVIGASVFLFEYLEITGMGRYTKLSKKRKEERCHASEWENTGDTDMYLGKSEMNSWGGDIGLKPNRWEPGEMK